MLVFFAVRSEQADPQTEIQCKSLCDTPIVLEIRLHDLVAVVVLGLFVRLLIACDVPMQQVGKGVSCLYS